MKFISTVLIYLLGPRLYLRIPQHWRRRLGMVCGEDFSDINAILIQLQGTVPMSNRVKVSNDPPYFIYTEMSSHRHILRSGITSKAFAERTAEKIELLLDQEETPLDPPKAELEKLAGRQLDAVAATLLGWTNVKARFVRGVCGAQGMTEWFGFPPHEEEENPTEDMVPYFSLSLEHAWVLVGDLNNDRSPTGIPRLRVLREVGASTKPAAVLFFNAFWPDKQMMSVMPSDLLATHITRAYVYAVYGHIPSPTGLPHAPPIHGEPGFYYREVGPTDPIGPGGEVSQRT